MKSKLLMADPKRTNERTETLLPKCEKFKTEKLQPIRAFPKVLTAEPIRV
jgi:hypothetical protein